MLKDLKLKYSVRKFNTLLALLIIVLTPLIGSAQLRVTGRIVDVSTNQPLEYAHIGIENTTIGTVTNSNGSFSLLIDDNAEHETLVVNYIGYSTKKISLKAVPEKNWVIKMQSITRRLEEVIVTTEKRSIVEEAIDAIPDNYDLEPMVINAFYRASLSHDDTVIQLTETALEIFRTPKRNKFETNLRIAKGRVGRDTIAFAGLMNVNAGIGPDVIIVASFLEDHRVIQKKFLKDHEFRLTDITSYDGFDVYVVEFDVANDEVKTGYQGKMLIDVESLAFIQISYQFSDKTAPPPLFKGSLAGKILGLQDSYWTRSETELNYHKVNGKWYASHVRYGSGWVLERTKMNYSEEMTYKAEFVITNIEKENIQLPEDGKFARNKILSTQLEENSDDFWAEYNYLSPDIDYDEVFRSIEARNSLR